VFAKLSQSRTLGVIVASGLLMAFYGIWFGYSIFARKELVTEH